MKKTLLFALAITLLCGCGGPEGKMKSAIKDYYTKSELGKSLIEDYDPISYGKPDSTYSTLETDPKYISLAHKFSTQDSILNGAAAGIIQLDSVGIAKTVTLRNAYVDSAKLMKDHFKPAFNGWKMDHKFRAKNKLTGLSIENSIEAIFDKDFNLKDIKTIDSK